MSSGSWNTIVALVRSRLQAGAAEVDSLTRDSDLSAGRPFQTQQREPDRGFPAARLSDEAKRLASLDAE